jgi:adenylate cyclase
MRTPGIVLLASLIAGSSITAVTAQGTLLKGQRDSLWAVWSDPTKADTIRLKALSTFYREGYSGRQPDSAWYYAQMQYDLAAQKGLKKYMAMALYDQAVTFSDRSDHMEALDHFQRALQIAEEIGEKKGIYLSSLKIGHIHSRHGEYVKALDSHQRSLRVAEEIGDRSWVSGALLNIGIVYLYQSAHPQALDHFQRSLKISEEIGDQPGMLSSLGNIGNIYWRQGDVKAMDYYQRIMKIAEDSGSKKPLAAALHNIGKIFSDQKDHVNALNYLQRSLDIAEDIGDKHLVLTALNNMGEIFHGQGNFPKALELYQQSLKISQEIESKSGVTTAYESIGSLKHDLKNYKESVVFCGNSLLLAEEMGAVFQQKEACQCLYDSYKAMGRDKKALVYLEKIGELDKQLNKEETTKQLERMEFQQVMLQDSIAKAEEARLIQESHQEEVRKSTRTRNALAVSGSLLLLLAGGFYSRARYMRRSRAVLQVEKDRSENLLLNILPAEIAEELKSKGRCEARDFDTVSILFTDFKGFTEHSATMSAAALVNEINHCFEAFDGIMAKYGIEKIKTIGDAYMAAGGLPVPTEDSVKNTVLAALEMQRFIKERKVQKDALGEPAFEMRVGIHTGPVVAGIVGVKKFQYDIWGDTVNTASRMESSGVVGQVNISESTYRLLKDDPQFLFSSRGKVEAKGKGEMEMFLVQEQECSLVDLEERPLESTSA